MVKSYCHNSLILLHAHGFVYDLYDVPVNVKHSLAICLCTLRKYNNRSVFIYLKKEPVVVSELFHTEVNVRVSPVFSFLWKYYAYGILQSLK